MKYRARYSGRGRTGICKCGHSWEEHHLGMVCNQDYYAATGESYVPQECEHYGCNQFGGLMPDPANPDGEWLDHCGSYEDASSPSIWWPVWDVLMDLAAGAVLALLAGLAGLIIWIVWRALA